MTESILPAEGEHLTNGWEPDLPPEDTMKGRAVLVHASMPVARAASRPSLQWALEAVTEGVAFLRDPHQNLLATNALGRAFYSPVLGTGGRTPNLARFQFLDPASRDFYPDWEQFAEMCVGNMRAQAGRDPHDRGLQDLVGELSTRSETFRRLWAQHDVRTHGTGTKHFNHPIVVPKVNNSARDFRCLIALFAFIFIIRLHQDRHSLRPRFKPATFLGRRRTMLRIGQRARQHLNGVIAPSHESFELTVRFFLIFLPTRVV